MGNIILIKKDINDKIILILYIILYSIVVFSLYYCYFGFTVLFSFDENIRSIMLILLVSVILFLVFEFVIMQHVMSKYSLGATLKKNYTILSLDKLPKFDDNLQNKISVSTSTFSTLTNLAFVLFVLLLGFTAQRDMINRQYFLIIISFSLISLLLSGFIGLLCLDKYDTAADPTWTTDEKWTIRMKVYGNFFWCWYCLIIGVIIPLSLIHPLLTLIGYLFYIIIRSLLL